jgi:hypothetical protein
MYGALEDKAFFFEDNLFTYNSHNWGIDPEYFESDAGLKSVFKVTATSKMPEPDNRIYTASIESDRYPFLGT